MNRDLLKEMNLLYGDRLEFQIILRDFLKKEQQKNNIIVEVLKEGGKTKWLKNKN